MVQKQTTVQGNVFCKFVPYNENLPHNHAVNPMAVPVLLAHCDVSGSMVDLLRKTSVWEDRTKNFAEAAHRRLQDAIGVDHSTVGGLLQDLKLIQRNHDKHYEDYLGGILLQKSKRFTMRPMQRSRQKYCSTLIQI
uniref:Uncharacterized protein n=1 Tax=Ditylenchus dipsaci TaxID=166011 RepID=A0A915DFM0_9BILA